MQIAPIECEWCLSCSRVPDLGRLVVTSAGNPRPVAVEGDARNIALVPFQRRDLLPRDRITDSDRITKTSTSNPRPIMVKGHAVNPLPIPT